MSNFLWVVLLMMIGGVLVAGALVIKNKHDRERAECEANPGHVYVVQRSGPNLCLVGGRLR